MLFIPPDAELEPLLPPSDTADDFVRPAGGIRFALDVTVDAYRLPVEAAVWDAVEERLGDEPFHRLLGEPEAIQGDPRDDVLPDARGDDWQLLSQLDSGGPLDFDFGDCGIDDLWRRADLVAHRWERGWLVLQCH